ncbi:MAG: hypothetical protein GY790_20425, partial [Bacteroidetes bacterium]|nr:hypothetical protein [Bacteroidota bacterium]
MKTATSRILLLGLLAISLLPVNAQKIGFGLGGSYQSSDIKNSIGVGFDFMLGSSIYQQENAFLALDWRFRFLAGYNEAYDHRVNSIGSYDNIRYTHFNYDLEFALTLNRLRERTGIIFSGFVGAGITHGITSTDLLDASNNAYDYSSILPNRDPSEILADLDQLTDKDFETRLQSSAAILPTAGIYLGYEFTPHFAMGVEHKMNFSLSEHSSTFGIDIDNQILKGSSLDWNNYTSLVFRWTLGGGSSGKSNNPVPDSDPVPSVVVFPPQVDIATPYANPYETSESSVKVTARIFNITRKEDISVKLNGQNQDFLFYSSISSVEINTNLRMGSNSLVISCQNSAGSDSDDLVLNYSKSVNPPSTIQAEPNADGTVADKTNITYVVRTEEGFPPEVKILQPFDPRSINYESTAEILAEISNVETHRDISFSINGINTNAFSFDRTTKRLIADVSLNASTTNINISAQNRFGSDSDSRIIIKETQAVEFQPCPKPVISFSVTESGTYLLSGTVRNVQYKGDIFLSVNGRPYNNLRFNSSYGEIQASLNLDPGTHTININARNGCGSVSEFKTIHIEAPCITPSVNMDIQEVSSENATHLLSARLQNVGMRDNIHLMINGTFLTDFQFSPTSGLLTASLNLEPGSHNILLVGMNECGSNRDSRTVVIKAPCQLPSVKMNISEVSAENMTHRLNASFQNVSSKSNVALMVDGTPQTNFRFNLANGRVSANFNLDPGSHTIVINANNECGSDSESKTITISEPCIPPSVSFAISEVNTARASHRLRGRIQNVK